MRAGTETSVAPKLTVVSLQPDSQANAWFTRSRYSARELHVVSLPSKDSSGGQLPELISELERCTADLVLLANERISYDEFFMTAAVDALVAEPAKQGVWMGAWLGTPSGQVFGELGTERPSGQVFGDLGGERKPGTLAELREVFARPYQVLGTAVLRRQEARRILAELTQLPAQAAWEWVAALRTGSDHVQLRQPAALISHPVIDSTVLEKRLVRLKLARLLLKASGASLASALPDINAVIASVRTVGLMHYPPNAEESELVDWALDAMKPPQPPAEALVMLMLFRLGYQLRETPGFEQIPAWLLEPYVEFLLTMPKVFVESDGVGDFCRHIEQVLMATEMFAQSNSAAANQVLALVTTKVNLVPQYFCADDTKSLNLLRARLTELALRRAQCPVDYSPPTRNRSWRIRIGVLNPVFVATTETYHTLPLFEHLDRSQFEVRLYALNDLNDPVAERCRACADSFTVLPATLNERVQLLRREDLDILLTGNNLTAVTSDVHVLFAHRLARVQMTLLGSPVTTGLSHMDYFISGKLTERDGAEADFSESLVLLDGTGFCFSYGESTPSDKTLSRADIACPENVSLFVSGANFYKIIPELRQAWATILAQVPSSMLVLYPFGPAWDLNYAVAPFRNGWDETLGRLGIAPERLVLLPALPGRALVKQVLRLCDVYLDSFHHGGGHSLVDPLEVGLPPVVLQGNYLRSRHAAGILRELQLEELITDDPHGYVECAVKLATERSRHAQLAQKIRTAMAATPGFLDSRAYGSEMSAVYRHVVTERK